MVTPTKKITKKTVHKSKTAKPVVKEVKAHVSKTTVPVLGLDGKAAGRMTIPEALFGVKINNALLAQSVRVYLANQREGSAKTKTRGEVEGSTRKIYRQKGTGKARHGSIRAPIFVGGGIVFGPVPRDYHLHMGKKMKRIALHSALTAKVDDMIVVDGWDILTKTKNVEAALRAIGVMGSALLVVHKDAGTFVRAARNIENLDIELASNLYPYVLLSHKTIIYTKQAVEECNTIFSRAL